MKANTNKLRKAVKGLIDDTVTSYYLYTEKVDNYPYAVFELRELAHEEGRTYYNLEINVMTKDAADCEDYTDEISETFDHLSYMDDYIAFQTYRASRLHVVEEDKSIHRNRLTISLYFYSREE